MSDGLRREIRPITSRGQWLDMRRGLITGSIVAVLFDAHPFLTRADLAAVLHGISQGDNKSMRRGRIVEASVAAAVAEEHPDWLIRKADTFHVIPELRVGVTPDYFVDSPRGLIDLQTKSAAPHAYEGWRGQFPLGYVIQVVTENLVCDTAGGYLAVLVAGGTFPLYMREVPRHPAAEARILEAVAAWWRAWDAGEIPPPAAAVAELAAELDDGSHVDLSGDNELPSLLDERARLKTTAGDAEKRLRAIDDTIRERVGAALTAYVPGWVIRYPSITARAYTVPERSYRRLDVRPTKEEETMEPTS